MRARRRVPRIDRVVLLVTALFACGGPPDKQKDERIAACKASGGDWVEGGCGDDGWCEGMSPASSDEDDRRDDGEWDR